MAKKSQINMDQHRKKRKKCKCFFFLNILLEGGAIAAVIYCIIFADCVLGNEVAGLVFIFSIFILAAFIPDLFYLILSRKLHTLGIDPLGVMFNFLMGVLCILIGISLVLVMVSYCGNYAQFILVIAGALSICSGIFHLMNAFMCHKGLPKSERYYRPHKGAKGAKKKVKGAKPSKADKKTGKKADKKGVPKKGDKKVDKKASKNAVPKKGDKKADKKSAKSTKAAAGGKKAGRKGVK